MGDEIVLEFDLGELPEYARSERRTTFRSGRPTDTLWRNHVRLRTATWPMPVNLSEAADYQAATLPGGAKARQVSLRFQPRLEPEDHTARQAPEDPLTITVVRDTAELDATLATLAWLLLVVMGLTVALTVFLLGWLVEPGITAPQRLSRGNYGVGIADLAERLQIADAQRSWSLLCSGSMNCWRGSKVPWHAKSRSPPTWPTSYAHRSPDCAPPSTSALPGHDRPRSINKSLANACA